MRARSIAIVARREYRTRIRSKGFWIATLLLPILLAAWTVIPGLVIAKTRTSQRLVVVADDADLAAALADELAAKAGGQASFELEHLAAAVDAELASALDRRVLADEIDAWIALEAAALAANEVPYRAASVTNFLAQGALEGALTSVVQRRRLAASGFDPAIVAELTRPVALATIRVSETGSRADRGLAGVAVGLALFMILYVTTLIYGQQVMLGVLEEKSSRVMEVMLSTVRSTELMAGKLLGICLVGLTQLAIWAATAAALTAPGLLALMPWLPAGLELPRLSPAVLVHFFLFFLLGYFFYATFYAMVGAAFNNPQEAQQLASLGAVFVILPWVFFLPVLTDPDSTLAVVSSLVPFLTPFLMMLRIAIKTPPAWQIALGYAATAALAAVMVGVAARVYRVGILMYGKKPTLAEIWRWARHA